MQLSKEKSRAIEDEIDQRRAQDEENKVPNQLSALIPPPAESLGSDPPPVGSRAHIAQFEEMYTELAYTKKRTKMIIPTQLKLRELSSEVISELLQKFRRDKHLHRVVLYLDCYFDIKTDPKILARYWRRELSEFAEIEAVLRDARIVERAEKAASAAQSEAVQ